MTFTDDEIGYAKSQPVARFASVPGTGQPDVTPVMFDGCHFYIGGHKPTRTRRPRNVRAGNEKVALVIDDLLSLAPWTLRFLRVYSTAGLVLHGGNNQILRLTPITSWSSNLSGTWSPESSYTLPVHKKDHTAEPRGL